MEMKTLLLGQAFNATSYQEERPKGMCDNVGQKAGQRHTERSQ